MSTPIRFPGALPPPQNPPQPASQPPPALAPQDGFQGSPDAAALAQWTAYMDEVSMVGPDSEQKIEALIQKFSDPSQQSAAKMVRDLFRKPGITKESLSKDLEANFPAASPTKERLKKLIDGVFDPAITEAYTSQKTNVLVRYFGDTQAPPEELSRLAINFTRKARLSVQIILLARGLAEWLPGEKNPNPGRRGVSQVHFVAPGQSIELGFRNYQLPRDYFLWNQDLNERLKALDSNLGILLIPLTMKGHLFVFSPIGLVNVERRTVETRIPSTLEPAAPTRKTTYLVGTPMAKLPQLGATISFPESGIGASFKNNHANNATLLLMSLDEPKYSASLQYQDASYRTLHQALKEDLGKIYPGDEGKKQLTEALVEDNIAHEEFHDASALLFPPAYYSGLFFPSTAALGPEAENALGMAEECLCELNRLRILAAAKNETQAKVLLAHDLRDFLVPPKKPGYLVWTHERLATAVLLRSMERTEGEGLPRVNFERLSALVESASTFTVQYVRRVMDQKVMPGLVDFAVAQGWVSGETPEKRQAAFTQGIATQAELLRKKFPNLSSAEATHLIYNGIVNGMVASQAPQLQAISTFVFSDAAAFQQAFAKDVLHFTGKTAEEFNAFLLPN